MEDDVLWTVITRRWSKMRLALDLWATTHYLHINYIKAPMKEYNSYIKEKCVLVLYVTTDGQMTRHTRIKAPKVFVIQTGRQLRIITLTYKEASILFLTLYDLTCSDDVYDRFSSFFLANKLEKYGWGGNSNKNINIISHG